MFLLQCTSKKNLYTYFVRGYWGWCGQLRVNAPSLIFLRNCKKILDSSFINRHQSSCWIQPNNQIVHFRTFCADKSRPRMHKVFFERRPRQNLYQVIWKREFFGCGCCAIVWWNWAHTYDGHSVPFPGQRKAHRCLGKVPDQGARWRNRWKSPQQGRCGARRPPSLEPQCRILGLSKSAGAVLQRAVNADPEWNSPGGNRKYNGGKMKKPNPHKHQIGDQNGAQSWAHNGGLKISIIKTPIGLFKKAIQKIVWNCHRRHVH